MGSVFGFVRRNGHAANLDELAKMSVALAGVDDRAGRYVLQGRLAIGCRVARSCNADGLATDLPFDVFLGFSGIVDNRVEIVSLLRDTGGLSISSSDAELVFAAYRLWGLPGLNRLAGSFAFAFWDARAQQLVLARSAIAAPPLHYSIDASQVAFATMPRGLLALAGIKRCLNKPMLARSLIKLSGFDVNESFFEGIRRVPTGCAVIWEGGLPVVKAWWNAPEPIADSSPDEPAYACELRMLLQRVVGEMMPVQSPIGVLLSGGLDSAALTALAANHRPSRSVLSVTHVPGAVPDGHLPAGYVTDESALVRLIAAQYPAIDMRFLQPEQGFLLDGVESLFSVLERPLTNVGNLAWWRSALQMAADAGIDIMLAGMQGNLTASRSGGSILIQALSDHRWSDVRKNINRRELKRLVASCLPPHILWRWKALRGDLFAVEQRPWLLASPISTDFARTWDVDQYTNAWISTYFRAPPRDERPQLISALSEQDFGLYDYGFAQTLGVQCRQPFADPRVAHFCLSAPNQLFHWANEPRSLIRHAMAGLLPEQVLKNRMRGLQSADTLQRLKADRPRVLAELTRLESSDLSREVLDLKRMRALATEFPDETSVGRLQIQGVLVLGLMFGRFLCWMEQGGVG
jgi:asparagine synthase (glutamine-hydrolysing)